MGFPLNFVEGLRLTYFSTTWTLAYRELTTVKLVEAGPEVGEIPPPSGNAACIACGGELISGVWLPDAAFFSGGSGLGGDVPRICSARTSNCLERMLSVGADTSARSG